MAISTTAPVASARCEAAFGTVWKDAEDVLRAHGFRLDRTDRRKGLITTHPVGSQHFFEFWRTDVATRRDFWEATLRALRRRVSVAIEPDSTGASCQVEVIVRKERFSTPERQVNNSAAAFHVFRESFPSAQTGEPITPADSYWIDAGRDPAMEKKLLSQIVGAVRPL